MPKEAQRFGDHILAQALAGVQRETIGVRRHEVDPVQLQPGVGKLPEEFVRFGELELAADFGAHCRERVQGAVARRVADPRVRNRSSQEIAELGRETVGRGTFAGIHEQEGGRSENRNDALLQRLNVRCCGTLLPHSGGNQANDRIQLSVAQLSAPGSFRDRGKDGGGILNSRGLSQQGDLPFRRPTLVERAFDFGAEQARPRALPMLGPVAPVARIRRSSRWRLGQPLAENGRVPLRVRLPDVIVGDRELELEVSVAPQPQAVRRVRQLEPRACRDPFVQADLGRRLVGQVERLNTVPQVDAQANRVAGVDARHLGIVGSAVLARGPDPDPIPARGWSAFEVREVHAQPRVEEIYALGCPVRSLLSPPLRQARHPHVGRRHCVATRLRAFAGQDRGSHDSAKRLDVLLQMKLAHSQSVGIRVKPVLQGIAE